MKLRKPQETEQKFIPHKPKPVLKRKLSVDVENEPDKPRLLIKRKMTPTVPLYAPESHVAYSGKYKGHFPWIPEVKHKQVITEEKQLAELVDRMMLIPEFSFDTETNTVAVNGPNKKFKLVGISISWGEFHNYYIPVGHIRDEDINNQIDLDIVVEYLRKPFGRRNVRIIGQNLKFDMHVMKRVGISIKTKDVFDTMLASWLCDENTPNGLKENSLEKMGLHQTHFNEATSTVPNEIKKKYGYKANARIPFDLVLIKDGAPYAIADAFYTYMLYLGFKELLKEIGMDKIYERQSIPFLFTLFKMEERGVNVDVEKLKQMGIDMDKDLNELQYQIYSISGIEFNLNSSQQKAEILFGWEKPDTLFKDLTGKRRENYIAKNGVKPGNTVVSEANRNYDIIERNFGFISKNTTDSGNPSTDSDTIWRLSQMTYKNNKRKQQGVEVCKLLLKFSKLSKLKTAFVDGILENLYDDGRTHPNFKQIGTDSGRISCANPNLQQLPKASDKDKYQIRSVFCGSIDEKTGKQKDIIALDYHNLEMVCLTYFSKDANLTAMFANDDDAHGSTAVNMFNLDCDSMSAKKKYPHLRQAAKTINFLLMYGGGAGLLYENLKNDQESPLDLGSPEYLKLYKCKNGKEVAQVFIDKYFESYSGVADFITGQKRRAKKYGYVQTILGRKRRLPDINSRDREKASYCERLAVNSSIQGTAGDITSSAQNRIDLDEELKKLGAEMIIQVHDELVFECPEENSDKAIKIIKYYMEHPFGDDPSKQVPFLRADYDKGKTYQDAK